MAGSPPSRYTHGMSDALTVLLVKLRALKPELDARFGVSAIAVFGSHARAEAGPESDLDLLVDFRTNARPTLFSLARLDSYLEEALGVKVDLIPRESLNPRIEPYIRADLVVA
jgi:predicted nucleotidyltransferase